MSVTEQILESIYGDEECLLGRYSNRQLRVLLLRLTVLALGGGGGDGEEEGSTVVLQCWFDRSANAGKILPTMSTAN